MQVLWVRVDDGSRPAVPIVNVHVVIRPRDVVSNSVQALDLLVRAQARAVHGAAHRTQDFAEGRPRHVSTSPPSHVELRRLFETMIAADTDALTPDAAVDQLAAQGYSVKVMASALYGLYGVTRDCSGQTVP